MQGERERGVDAELVKKVDLMNEDDEAYLNAQDRSEACRLCLCLGLVAGGGCWV